MLRVFHILLEKCLSGLFRECLDGSLSCCLFRQGLLRTVHTKTHPFSRGFLQLFFCFVTSSECSVSLQLFFCLHSFSLFSFVRASTGCLQPCLRESLTRRFRAKEFPSLYKQHCTVKQYEERKDTHTPRGVKKQNGEAFREFIIGR